MMHIAQALTSYHCVHMCVHACFRGAQDDVLWGDDLLQSQHRRRHAWAHGGAQTVSTVRWRHSIQIDNNIYHKMIENSIVCIHMIHMVHSIYMYIHSFCVANIYIKCTKIKKVFVKPPTFFSCWITLLSHHHNALMHRICLRLPAAAVCFDLACAKRSKYTHTHVYVSALQDAAPKGVGVDGFEHRNGFRERGGYIYSLYTCRKTTCTCTCTCCYEYIYWQ